MDFIRKVNELYKAFIKKYEHEPNVILLGYEDTRDMKFAYDPRSCSPIALYPPKEGEESEFEIMGIKVIQVRKDRFMDMAICLGGEP